jgi:hypothetical protein
MPPPDQSIPSREVDDLPARKSRGARSRLTRLLALAALAVSLVVALPVAAQVIQHSATQGKSGNSSPAGPQSIGRADLHLDSQALEINLSITQNENACQAPLNGQVCLRYSIASDDKPLESGYGLIPNGDVTVKGSSIRVDVDTSTGKFQHLTGQGGQVSITWTWQGTPLPVTAAGQTSTLVAASVTGSVIGRTLPASGITASVLLYSSG